MNERIKKLSKQAWKYTNDTVGDREVGHHRDAFEEKFAELIVRECARFVHKAQPNGLALDVLEHFGVE